MVFRAVCRAVFVGLLLAAQPVVGQGITERQADEILKELRAIRQMLERQQAPQPRQAQAPTDDRVAIAFGPTGNALGRSDAPLVLVEYTDYQCPFCRQFHMAAFEEIKRNYIDPGRVRYISRDFPLAFHENARPAARAARCAGEQGKFWELRHAMIVNADQLKAQNILDSAKTLNLDMNGFQACLESGRYAKEVDQDMAEGTRAGVSGTPSFVIGRLIGGQLEGVRLVGAMPYQALASALDEALKKAPVR